MIVELCCCTIAFIIIIVIFFRVFGRTAIFYPRRAAREKEEQQYYQSPQPYQQPQYQPQVDDVNMTKCQYCGRVYDERLPGVWGEIGRLRIRHIHFPPENESLYKFHLKSKYTQTGSL